MSDAESGSLGPLLKLVIQVAPRRAGIAASLLTQAVKLVPQEAITLVCSLSTDQHEQFGSVGIRNRTDLSVKAKFVPSDPCFDNFAVFYTGKFN